jgi:predicted ABC-type ATPase
MPLLTVFAGPNGSGKSSVIRGLAFEGRDNLLDTDAIARRINPSDPRRAAGQAGRQVVLRAREFVQKRETFAMETTLAGNTALALMRRAAKQGFIVRLVYVCLDNPEKCIQRVRERVAQGGHDVLEEDVRRRYNRSLLNLPAALRLANEAVVYDNSGSEPRKVLVAKAGVVIWTVHQQPTWMKAPMEKLSNTAC